MEPLGIGLHRRRCGPADWGGDRLLRPIPGTLRPRPSDARAAPRAVRRRLRARLDGLVAIPAGSFTMGTDDPAGYPADGEGPAHQVDLPAYEIGADTVTNAQFAAFVAATEHRTERRAVRRVVRVRRAASRRLPTDPSRRGRPVVARGRGRRLAAPRGPAVVHRRSRRPSRRARQLAGRCRVLRVERHPPAHRGRVGASRPRRASPARTSRGETTASRTAMHRMNVFQGEFPARTPAPTGGSARAPWGAIRPTGSASTRRRGTCGSGVRTGSRWRRTGRRPERRRPDHASGSARVMRGGSYLCHESYCWRYRVDARSANTPDSSTGNLGFRVAR